ncbi:MAG TPA: adenosine deaminase [Trebonia sp.]|nr:adenosine deaminase [Trebonia sp.]
MSKNEVMVPVPGSVARSPKFPKIELHVHLEGTVRARTLLQIAKRNGVPLPADTVEGLAGLYQFRDFQHFIEVWRLTTGALRAERDFRQVVVDYAAEAARHGAVYVEGIFTPAEPAGRGCDWDEVFAGYCDGAQQAAEQHGVQVRLTPDIPRGYSLEMAELTARHAVAYRDRGVVGIGLGGPEAQYPPEPYARAFEIARDGGLGSVPHAGEAAGPSSVRGALETLRADRIRHGIRAADDPGLLRELAARGVVLDVCLISNLRTGVVASLSDHPLPALAAAGVACSVSTDDPAMFDTDLSADYAAARELGVSARECYLAGQRGALCDAPTKSELEQIGDAFAWAGIDA